MALLERFLCVMKLLSMFEETNLTLSLKYLLNFPMEEFVQLVDRRLD
jgi:hypothetical protein